MIKIKTSYKINIKKKNMIYYSLYLFSCLIGEQLIFREFSCIHVRFKTTISIAFEPSHLMSNSMHIMV